MSTSELPATYTEYLNGLDDRALADAQFYVDAEIIRINSYFCEPEEFGDLHDQLAAINREISERDRLGILGLNDPRPRYGDADWTEDC